MPKKKHTAEEIINKLREAEGIIAAGGTVAEAVRRIGVSEQTFYRWRSEYGGLRVDQARRLKQLETENSRLKRAVAELTLDNQILKEAGRETSEPRPSPPLRRTRRGSTGGVGAAGLQGAGATPLHPAPRAAGQGRRAGPDQRHRGTGHQVRPVRLPADHRPAEGCRVASEPQAGGADLAAGGVEGAGQAAQKGTAVAERRVHHPAEAGEEKPRMGLGLRPHQDPGRASGAVVDCHR